MSPSVYDVFFSYHWQDRAAVEHIAHALEERGLRVFVDRWYLTPGQPWMDRLATALSSCSAVVVVIGPHGLGRWQQRERDLALDRQTREPAFPVIPVLLPNAEPALDFLGLNTWIDLRGGVGDSIQYEILSKAVRGEPPAPDIEYTLQRTRAEVCPYRGLRPFREEDARFFCGREAFIETLTASARRRSFIAVVGASGSGKSSVVHAGLLPRLRRRSDRSPVYEIVTMVPGENPLLRLAAALVPLLEPGSAEIQRLGKAGELAELFRNRRVSLQDVLIRALEKQPGTDRLLLVVDQSEELYTLCREDALRQHFVGELLASTDRHHLTVVQTLRADFYGRLLGNRALADRLQDGVVNLGPMRREELLRAILQPAQEVGLRFEDGLVERLLDDVGDEPGNLPLLEFVLDMLWQRRSHGEIHHQAYLEIGGVRGAIANRANEIYEALPLTQQDTARRTLIRLVRPGEGTEDTRRRAVLEDLDADVGPVVERLAAARLLVTGRDPALGKETVEVSHEALIQRWDLLRKWIDEDREFLRTRERIAAAAEHWQANQQDASLLAAPGRPLAEAQDLLIKRRGDLDSLLIEFVEDSINVNQARAQKERDLERRRARRARMVAVLMIVLAVSAAGFGMYARREAKSARASAASARASLNDAQITQSRFLASLSQQETDAGNDSTGILLALQALPSNVANPNRPYVIEAETSLYKAVGQNRQGKELRGHAGVVLSGTFSPDGTRVVTASADNTARVWDAASGRSLAVLQGHTRGVNSAAFGRDGTRIVTASADNTARLWDAASGHCLAVLRGHGDQVDLAAFSPDGSRIVTASEDLTARLWDAASGRSLALLQGHTHPITAVAFSFDGTRLVTAAYGAVRVWDAASGRSLWQSHTGQVNSAAVSPDGTRIVTASWDQTAQMWDFVSGRRLTVLQDHGGSVNSAAFNPDGTRIVTSSSDSTARVWDAASGRNVLVLRGHADSVNSATFSPDGSRILTASDDHTLRLWDVASGRSLSVLLGHADRAKSATFSPDGTRIVSISADKTARVWNASSDFSLLALQGHTDGVHWAAFNRAGTRIVTASEDRTARMWDAASGQILIVLRGHTGAIYTAAFSPDSARIVTASEDTTAQVWDAISGHSMIVLHGHGGAVYGAAFSPDGNRIVTASADNTARVWDAASGRNLTVLRNPNPTTEGDAFWSSSSSGAAVYSAGFSPDGSRILTASEDQAAWLWDAASGRSLRVLTGGDFASVTSAAFSPDGSRIVTASGHFARLWDTASRRRLVVLQGHTDTVKSAAFSPDGTRILTASQDHTARLWDTASGQNLLVLQGHSDAVESAAFSADGTWIVTASKDHTARLWRAFPTTQSLIDYARALVPQQLQLTAEQRQRFFLDPTATSPDPKRNVR